jgi:hypothetical protein
MTIKNPFLGQFNLFYQQYSDSIQYQNFIRFDPQFHCVCVSDFVTSETWLELDYHNWEFNDYGVPAFRANKDDYRQIASPLFQLLSSFLRWLLSYFRYIVK